MFAFRPRKVIYEVLDRGLKNAAASDSEFGIIGPLVIVQPTEVNKRLGIVVTDIAKALPCEAPMEVID